LLEIPAMVRVSERELKACGLTAVKVALVAGFTFYFSEYVIFVVSLLLDLLIGAVEGILL
jgi:hypothetical protein